MCFMNSPEAPPPPPPPPAAPPVLDQAAPQLSNADEQNTYLNRRSQGFKAYKIERQNQRLDRSNRIGGIQSNNSSTNK